MSDASLVCLSKELGPPISAMKTIMYLNVPTTQIVDFKIASDEEETPEAEFAQTLLLHWKRLKANAKDKDKINDLERALRELGKPDLAAILMERHADNQELTSDCFD